MSFPFGPSEQATSLAGTRSMIYLASPYSHNDAAVRKQRYHDACLATAALLRAGQNVFSPIVHGHPLTAFGLPTDWQYWEEFDREHISRCDELYVLTLDGWQESVGVRAEIKIATELERPVRYISLDGAIWCNSSPESWIIRGI